jgi:hypothetical protein
MDWLGRPVRWRDDALRTGIFSSPIRAVTGRGQERYVSDSFGQVHEYFATEKGSP